jgi:molybdenum storage protein
MSKFVTGDGRTHIASPLMRESLVDRRVVAKTDSEKEYAILPDVTLVGIGGQSIFDRGKEALLPLVEELALARLHHKIIVGVGGGTRVRHTVAIAIDFGLPTGGIAQLVGAMEEANAVFLNALMAKHGSIVMQREHFWELPLYLNTGVMPIVISIPPYHFWEPPPEHGPLPTHGSDFGLFIHAEVLGMRHVIFVKDEDGVYDKDPKAHSDAKLLRELTLAECLDRFVSSAAPSGSTPRPPGESMIDPQLFTAWSGARHVERVQIVNGLKRGELTRALAGEDAGTIIERDATTRAARRAQRQGLKVAHA